MDTDGAGRVRRFVPFGLLAVAPLAASLATLAPDPSGHWTGHLGNAAVAGAQRLPECSWQAGLVRC